MRKIGGVIAVASFAIGLLAGALIEPLTISRIWEVGPMTDPMDYQTFRDKAVAELETNPDLISFKAEAPFLQEMRRSAAQWEPLLRNLMADQSVSLDVKIGALPAIFDLPAEQLVNFADHLNSLSLMQPELFPLVMLAVTNSYRSSGFMKKDMIADTSLIDLDHRRDAQTVLSNIARNPSLDKDLLQPGQFMERYAPHRSEQ